MVSPLKMKMQSASRFIVPAHCDLSTFVVVFSQLTKSALAPRTRLLKTVSSLFTNIPVYGHTYIIMIYTPKYVCIETERCFASTEFASTTAFGITVIISSSK